LDTRPPPGMRAPVPYMEHECAGWYYVRVHESEGPMKWENVRQNQFKLVPNKVWEDEIGTSRETGAKMWEVERSPANLSG
jgi:hypothetical protein